MRLCRLSARPDDRFYNTATSSAGLSSRVSSPPSVNLLPSAGKKITKNITETTRGNKQNDPVENALQRLRNFPTSVPAFSWWSRTNILLASLCVYGFFLPSSLTHYVSLHLLLPDVLHRAASASGFRFLLSPPLPSLSLCRPHLFKFSIIRIPDASWFSSKKKWNTCRWHKRKSPKQTWFLLTE